MTPARGAHPNAVDVAIVGAGASGAHTLLSLLEALSAAAAADEGGPARVVVIDRDPQFFAGVAYGNRSGPRSLTLSTLSEFVPDDERARFSEWLTAHINVLHGEHIDTAWIERHRDDISAGRWNDLFIPRRLYGAYLADRSVNAILAAESDGTAKVTLACADVADISPSGGGYVVTTTDSDGAVGQIVATVVVLAIGSPPVQLVHADDANEGIVHDLYDPGLDATFTRLRAALVERHPRDRRILVVGGNAAALEFVPASQDLLRDLDARITVLSPSGRPRHWRRRRADDVPDHRAITALKDKVDAGGRVAAAELFEAVSRDVSTAVAAGTDAASIPHIAASIPYFLGSLGDIDRAALAAHYGVRMSNLLRQDSGDSVDILESLVERNSIEFRAGRFVRCERRGENFRVIVSRAGGHEQCLDDEYAVVVGAMGFERVSTTRGPLLRSMLRARLVTPSSSDTGLEVDADFRAAAGLFVVGPLVAGNVAGGMVIWHAESVRRIIAIARKAAPHIVQELKGLV